MSDNSVFPGDKIASIEEYEAGHNTFDDGDMVRSSTMGEKNMDKETRVVNVSHPKLLSIPKVGDIIIGTVAAVMSSMVAITCVPDSGENSAELASLIPARLRAASITMHCRPKHKPSVGILFSRA